MTQEERIALAREIERQEFEAECAALRRRALEIASNKTMLSPVSLQKAATRPDAKPTPAPRRRKSPQTSPERRARASFIGRYNAFEKSLTLKEWEAETGISRYTLRTRLNAGCSMEKALTEPLRHHGRKSGLL